METSLTTENSEAVSPVRALGAASPALCGPPQSSALTRAHSGSPCSESAMPCEGRAPLERSVCGDSPSPLAPRAQPPAHTAQCGQLHGASPPNLSSARVLPTFSGAPPSGGSFNISHQGFP